MLTIEPLVSLPTESSAVAAGSTSWLSTHLSRITTRPRDIVEGTRWLFAGLVLLSFVFTMPGVLVNSSDQRGVTLIMLCGGILVVSWFVGYLRRRSSYRMDVLDSVAVFGLTLASSLPSAVFGLVFSMLWFRSLYGSTRHAVIRALLYVGAVVAATLVWPNVFGRTEQTDAKAILFTIPMMLLTVIVGRRLASALAARQRQQHVDAIQADVGFALLGEIDAAGIEAIVHDAGVRVTAAIPGLRIFTSERDGAVLRTAEAWGPWATTPTAMPAQLVDVELVDGDGAGAAAALLDSAAGARCAWAAVPLPQAPGGASERWLIVGAPGEVPEDALTVARNLAVHVALARNHSDVHRELKRQAAFDGLTGLANRATFNEVLASALAESETSVLFIDLDDFKRVNDVHGHRAGDRVLNVVAERLRRATRPGDLCARIGGDEFAVVLRETGATAAADVARRVIADVCRPAQLPSETVRVSASVGAATADARSDPELLLHRADAAMYDAKSERAAITPGR